MKKESEKILPIKIAFQYLRSKGIIHTQQDVADRLNVSKENISRLFNGREGYHTPSYLSRFNKAFDSIFNENWLLTGEGEMLANPSPQREGILSQNESVPNEANYKLVPVIHVDSVGGVHSRNDIVNESQFVEGYVPFVNAQDDDRAIYQSGNSMIPTIPPGSLLQIREVSNWKEYFGYGNIFVIELTDGRRITKEINKYEENPKEYVWCHSHNPSVADEELPRNMIVSVWKVIKVLTDKGW